MTSCFPLDLGSTLTHVTAHVTTLNTIIGVSCQMKNYLMSKDSGDSWIYINRDYVAHLTSYFQVVSVVPIPFERVPQTFEPGVTGSGCTLYTIRDWNCKLRTVTNIFISF